MGNSPLELLPLILCNSLLLDCIGDNLFWPEAVTRLGSTAANLINFLSAETINDLAVLDEEDLLVVSDHEVWEAITEQEGEHFPIRDTAEDDECRKAWRILTAVACLQVSMIRDMG